MSSSDLLSGRKWNIQNLEYTFISSPPLNSDYRDGNNILLPQIKDGFNSNPQFSDLTAAQQEVTGLILDKSVDNPAVSLFRVSYSDVTNTTFRKTQSGVGEIAIGSGDLADPPGKILTGKAYFPFDPPLDFSGDVWLDNQGNPGALNLLLNLGEYGYWDILHELGHAFGGLNDAEDILNSTENTQQYTVMSYNPLGWSFNPQGQLVAGANAIYFNDNSALRAYGLQLYDIAALQSVYGSNTSVRAGDTSYKLGQGLGRDSDQSKAFIYTIWDGDGITAPGSGKAGDTLDASGFTTFGARIDLRPGSFSSIGENGSGGAAYDPSLIVGGVARDINNVAIAYGVTIENAIGTIKNDHITGNNANNIIQGGKGADMLIGGAGNDTYVFNGGDGYTFNTAMAVDTIQDGGDQNRIVFYNQAIKTVGFGTDFATHQNLRVSFTQSEVVAQGQYDGVNGLTVVTLEFRGDAGNVLKTVDLASSLLQADLIAGSFFNAVATFTASSSDASVKGSSAGTQQDRIYGLDGKADTLIGSLGNDILKGGTGADTYVWNLGDGADIIFDDWAEGDMLSLSPGIARSMITTFVSGADLGISINAFFPFGNNIMIKGMGAAAGMFLADRVTGYTPDMLNFAPATSGDTLWGTLVFHPELNPPQNIREDRNDTVSGTAGNDRIEGRNGNDTLSGLGGNDYIIGGAGNDVLDGGDNNDRLEDQDGGTLNGGAGNDYLVIGGAGTLNGGDDNDTLNATAGGVTFNGGKGQDVIYAVQDNNTINGGDDDDIIMLKAGSNQFTSSAVIDGGDGNDVMHLSWGASTIKASSGNDIIYKAETASGFTSIVTIDFTASSLDSLDFEHIADGRNLRITHADGTIVLAGFAARPQDWFASFGGGAAQSLANVLETINLSTSTSSVTVYGEQLLSLADITTGAGSDTIFGGDGDNTIVAGAGQDTVHSGDGNDTVHGGDDIDEIHGDGGNDTLFGEGGHDQLFGGVGQDIIWGGAGDDVIEGNDDNDTIHGEAGNNAIDGGAGNDIIDAGDGDDTITDREGTGNADPGNNTINAGNGTNIVGTGSGVDVVTSGSGIDTITTGAGNDTISSGGGSDLLSGGLDDDTIDGGSERDTIYGEEGNDKIQGGSGDDFIAGDFYFGSNTGFGNDIIDGGAGNDEIHGGAGDDDIQGGDGIDSITAGAGNDTVHGGEDNDGVLGSEGDDMIWGGNGNDSLSGAEDNDTIHGDAGTDFIHGNDGNDTLYGEADNDQMFGDAGNDTIVGGDGNDALEGNAGADTIDGGIGTDTIRGGTGADIISGGDGNDNLSGEDDNDTISGGANSDFLNGGAGADILNGDAGDDTIDGGTGGDAMSGGDGNDVYTVDNAGDTITELSVGGTDLVRANVDWTLGANLEALTMIVAGLTGTGNNDANTLFGTSGADTLNGLGGNDIIDGGDGADVINGGDGDDSIQGESIFAFGGGNDTINGGAGNDNIKGNAGNDILDGGTGDDKIYGGDQFGFPSGNDRIISEFGNDKVVGGDGTDTLEVGSSVALGDISFYRTTGFINGTANADLVVVLADGRHIQIGNQFVQTSGVYVDRIETLVYGAGSTIDLTAIAPPVGGSGNEPTGGVTISGMATEDEVLRASNTLSDADGLGAISYQWQRNAGSSFSDIAGQTSPTYTLGDFDVGAMIRVVARYTDGGGMVESVASAATAAVANVNDAPVVANAISDQTSPEDQAWSFQVATNAFTDVDSTTLTYSATLADGSALPGWLFTAATRTFSGVPPLNFNGAIHLRVTASDGLLSVFDTFSLTVTPVNDAPTVTSNGGDSAAIVVPENITVATTITANDPDSGTTLTYSISGGDDAVRFAINAATGALSFLAAPDFETPTDADHNNSYIVQVAVSDGSLLDSQTITVNVTDVAPVIVGDGGNNTLQGTSENDTIRGLGGNDVLDGSAFTDVLDGGTGNDTLTGGSGNDSFVFHAGEGRDVVVDLQSGAGAGDVVQLDATRFGSFTDVRHAMSWTGNGHSLNMGGGNSVILRGKESFELAADDFTITNTQSGTPPFSGIDSRSGHHFSGDFFGDHRNEVIWRDGSNQIYTGALAPNLTMQTTLLGSAGNYAVAGTGDFNRDGKSDILFSRADGDVAVWLMNGTAFGGVDLGFAVGYEIVGTGDFDGNGASDILFRQTSTGQLAAWEFTGSGTNFGGLNIGTPLPSNYQVVGTGDLNGDHKTDILLQSDTGQLAVWVVNADGSIGGFNLGPPLGTSYQVVGVGDINGDGRDDIVFRGSDGQPAAWLMNSDFSFGGAYIGSVVHPSAYTLAGVGDSNGDGKADLIFRALNADGGGELAVWLLNGTTPIATAVVDPDHHTGWMFA